MITRIIKEHGNGGEKVFRAKFFGQKSVMINFMGQLDWAMGYADIWSNIILSASVRAFLDKINI